MSTSALHHGYGNLFFGEHQGFARGFVISLRLCLIKNSSAVVHILGAVLIFGVSMKKILLFLIAICISSSPLAALETPRVELTGKEYRYGPVWIHTAPMFAIGAITSLLATSLYLGFGNQYDSCEIKNCCTSPGEGNSAIVNDIHACNKLSIDPPVCEPGQELERICAVSKNNNFLPMVWTGVATMIATLPVGLAYICFSPLIHSYTEIP